MPMSNALKMALVVGVAIAVETFVLRQLFLGFPRGVFVGAFLIASVLLVFLQYLLMKRWWTRTAPLRRRQPQSEPASSFNPGLNPLSTPIFHSIEAPERNGALPEQEQNGVLPEQEQHAALSDEDGIIQ
jgi:hypothetical protein